MIKNFKSWIKSAGIRALKTFAQTFISVIGTGAAVLGDVNWVMVLSSAALAAILSIATSLAGLPEVNAKETTVEIKAEDIVAIEETNEVPANAKIVDSVEIKEDSKNITKKGK